MRNAGRPAALRLIFGVMRSLRTSAIVGRMVFGNLVRRPLRSLLTILGIGVGVAAVVALTTFADGLVSAFSNVSATSEADMVVSQQDAMVLVMSVVDADVGDELRALRGVDAVAGTVVGVMQLPEVPYFLVIGEDPDEFLLGHYRLIAGDPISDRGEVMLGARIARRMDILVGDHFGIGQRRYTVAGIYETGTAFEDGGAVLSLEDAQTLFDKRDRVSYFSVRLRDPSFAAQVRATIEERWPDVTTSGSAASAERFDAMQIYRSLGWFFSMFAVIIGGFGMTNTLLMSVLERTHDIGILRALGWRRRRVVGMIIAESLLLSSVGGVVGIGLGYGLIYAAQWSPATEALLAVDVSMMTVGQAFLGALGIGAVAGIYPALRAAGMQPIEAMRVEGAAGGGARFGGSVLRGLLRRPMRTLTTVVGLGIGVGFIVALTAVVDGFTVLFSQLGGAGDVDLMVEQAEASAAAFSAIDEHTVQEIERRSDVAAVSRLVLGVSTAPGAPTMLVFGLDPREEYIEHFVLIEGRAVARADEIMLGRQIAASTKKSVDDHMTLSGRRLHVVGIYENGQAFEDYAGVMTLREAQRMFHKAGQVSFLGVRVADPSRADEIAAAIEFAHPEVIAARVVNFTDRMNDMRVTRAALDVVVGITVAVGALLMTNAMLMSVFERTREFGILRALGWRRRRLMWMVVRESLVLCLAAALVGIGIGVGMAAALQREPTIGMWLLPQYSTALFVRTTALVLLFGLVGSLYPALRAAMMTPVEALRYE